MDIRFAGGRAIPVGPENVFVGPPCRNFSRAHSVRIVNFVGKWFYSRGALLGKWSTLLRARFRAPQKQKVSELGPTKKTGIGIRENAENSSLIYLYSLMYLSGLSNLSLCI